MNQKRKKEEKTKYRFAKRLKAKDKERKQYANKIKTIYTEYFFMENR